MKQRSVTASLEGMRVVVEDGTCRLEEYDFVKKAFFGVDVQRWPLSYETATAWLTSWNQVDRLNALSVLVADSLTFGENKRARRH